MVGDGVRDLATDALHGHVVEIEWRGCGHGARSMTGAGSRVNRAAVSQTPSAFVLLLESLHHDRRDLLCPVERARTRPLSPGLDCEKARADHDVEHAV
jgi:hypothetical protein